MILEHLNDILELFYPNDCIGCTRSLSKNDNILCTHCFHDLPYAYYTQQENNPLDQLFFGKIPLEFATSLLIFQPKGIVQNLIHELKYNNNQKIGALLGTLLNQEILSVKNLKPIDYIIPVPLHKNKLKSRGYNQLTRMGNNLSKHLKAPMLENVLIKINATETQTKKNRLARWENAQHNFQIQKKDSLKGKHVLLFDDVITTGATMENCAKELLKTKNITLSIASIAHTINF